MHPLRVLGFATMALLLVPFAVDCRLLISPLVSDAISLLVHCTRAASRVSSTNPSASNMLSNGSSYIRFTNWHCPSYLVWMLPISASLINTMHGAPHTPVASLT
ncbi:hypothetical protein V8C35DRAFT_299206 [Trichoderma chlorosporum]